MSIDFYFHLEKAPNKEHRNKFTSSMSIDFYFHLEKAPNKEHRNNKNQEIIVQIKYIFI